MKESVAIVNEKDEMYGTMDKLAAHRSGTLHRALSVFVFNNNGELLLQQRAFGKYHSGGLWSNTCCSHPRLGEYVSLAASRRLMEEMGMTCELSFAFNFTYYADMDNGFIEHEFDHVFIGISDDLPTLNLDEAIDYKYMTMNEVKSELEDHPEDYSQWLKVCFKQITKHHTKLFEHGPVVN